MTSSPNLTLSAAIGPLLSDELYALLDIVLVQYLLTTISSFGIITNLINILVYARMGTSDTSNLNFLALSVSDLITVLYMLITAAGHIPELANLDLPVSPISLQNIIVPVVYPAMAYSSWITALISTERCFCIAYPLQVKSVFTVRRIFITIVVLLGFEISSLIPHYVTMNLNWQLSSSTNKSRLTFSFTEYSARVSVTILLVFFSIPSLISFLTVVFCTCFLVMKLNQSLRWRKSTLGQPYKAVPVKEMKVVRSVIAICIIYIACFFPNVMAMPVSMVYPRFHVMDPYLGNVVFTIFYGGCVLQAISSSVNIFVYYSMSTKYKETVCRAICK